MSHAPRLADQQEGGRALRLAPTMHATLLLGTLALAACARAPHTAAPAASDATSVVVPLSASAPSAHAREEGESASAAAAQPARFDHEHTSYTRLLAQLVRDGRVDYRALRARRDALRAYLGELYTCTPAQLADWSRAQQLAYWINVHNAHVLKLVADNYPVGSVLELGSAARPVWQQQQIPLPAHHPLGLDEELSLEDVVQRILRARHADARALLALHRAALGGPALRGEAYVAARLEQQLDEQARAFLADSSLNRFDPAAARAEVSELFRWHAQDFEREAGSLGAWLARHAPGAPAGSAWLGAVRPSYLPYDWRLAELASASDGPAASAPTAGAR